MIYAQDQAVQHDVLAPRELRVEPRSQREQRHQPAVDLDRALRRLQDAGDYAQEGALAGPVAAYDAQGRALLHVQVYVFEGPEVAAVPLSSEAQGLLQPGPTVRERPEILGYAFYGDGGHVRSDPRSCA